MFETMVIEWVAIISVSHICGPAFFTCVPTQMARLSFIGEKISFEITLAYLGIFNRLINCHFSLDLVIRDLFKA